MNVCFPRAVGIAPPTRAVTAPRRDSDRPQRSEDQLRPAHRQGTPHV